MQATCTGVDIEQRPPVSQHASHASEEEVSRVAIAVALLIPREGLPRTAVGPSTPPLWIRLLLPAECTRETRLCIDMIHAGKCSWNPELERTAGVNRRACEWEFGSRGRNGGFDARSPLQG